RKTREPTEPLVGTRDPRDLAARGRLHPKALGPRSQGPPHEDVEGQHDCRKHPDSDRDRRDVAVPARDGDESSEARPLELRPARGEDLAGDEKEPTVRPREDGVVDELRDRRRECEVPESEPAPQAEARGGRLEVRRDRGQGFVHAERHVPRHAREDQEHDRELDSDRMAVEGRDEEDQGRGEETQDRNGLEHIEEREQRRRGAFVRRRSMAVGDGEDQGEQVGDYHPRRGKEREQRELNRVPGRLGEGYRRDDAGKNQDDGDEAEPPPQAAHNRPQRADPIYGFSRGPQTPARNRARIAFCAWSRFSAWSKTIDCGPSITSSVISRPRCAGRQCITRASGFARSRSFAFTWYG